MKNLHDFEEFLNEARLNEAKPDIREIVADNPGAFKDALEFLKRGMGADALKKACKGKIPYTIFLQDKSGMPKPGGLYSTAISFMADGSNPKMEVSDFIDKVNGVLDDHGFDKYKVKINK